MSTTSQPPQTMKRDDYKAVKRMNKEQLTAYLKRIYMRGYEAGLEAAASSGTLEKAEGTDGG